MNPIAVSKTNYAALKLPTKIEDVFIWRLQLVLTTNTIKDAGTDSAVYAQFADGEKNKFWLDKGINDRERGMNTAYDIVLPNLKKVSDIKFLRIGIEGTDGWNIKAIKLIVNNQPGRALFEKDYGTKGLWLEKEGNKVSVLTIPSTELRNQPKWKPTPASLIQLALPPFSISRDMLESMIECRIGHEIENKNKYPSNPKMKQLYWGKIHGRPVEIVRKSANTLSVDLDLAADVSWLPDPGVDIDFDLKFSCKDKRIQAEALNVKINVSSFFIDLLNFLVPFGDVVKTSFNFNQNFNVGMNIPTKCPDITIDANANIGIVYYV